MVTAKVTSKGQITLPKEIRDELRIGPGDEVEFVKENGTIKVRRKPVDPDAIYNWVGSLKHLQGQDVDELIRQMRGG